MSKVSASFLDRAADSILDGNEAFTKIALGNVGLRFFGDPKHEGFVLAKAPTAANPEAIKAVVFVPDASALRFIVVISTIDGIEPVSGMSYLVTAADHYNTI